MLLGGMIAGAAESYSVIIVGRLLSGAGAAFLFVLMMKMLTDWFVDKELFIAISIFIIGWPIGIATGQVVQASIAETTSWSVVFYLTAITSAIAYLIMVVLYRTPPELQQTPTGSFFELSFRELFLVTIAGFVWMFINGAYLVLLSFGPVFLQEQGTSFADAGVVVSLMSWVFVFSLPLGGFLATRFKAPNVIMFAGLTGTIIVGLLIPYTNVPFVTFTLFGILYAMSAPIVAAFPAEVLSAGNRGPGYGIYYVWYYLGSAFLPVAGGYLKDVTGTAASSVLFAVAMMVVTLMLAGLFRLAQVYVPLPSETED
jgi:MFS family permease